MASKRPRLQPDIEKQGVTNSDSIVRILDELLDSGRGKSKYAEKSRLQLDNQPAGVDVDETSCDLCKSYFPLLKSFIFHIESCHKGNGQAGCFKCNLCDVESDSAITLGMHALLHVCGKTPGKDMHLLSIPSISQVSAEQNETAASDQNSPGNRHVSTRMYTRLLEQSVKNVTEKDVGGSPAIEAGSKEGETSSKSSTSSSLCTNIVQRKRRGRPPKGKKVVSEASIVPAPLMTRTKAVPEIVQGGEKSTVLTLSSLLPSLQCKENEVTDKANDISVIENIIRPRESTPTSFEISGNRGVDAYEKSFANNEHESTVPRSSFEVQDNSKDASSSQFVIAGKGIRKVEDYSLAETDSNVKASSLSADKQRRNAKNQCIICLEKFPSKELLKQHRLGEHGDRDKWVCTECDRDFSSHWKYRDHCVKVHNNKKPFKCDICGKCLSSFTILATHEGLHSGARPHECEICGKSYLVAAGLKEHLISHRNEREHRCTVCGAGFNAKGDLKKHMVTHMSEKPHICQVCNTGFNRTASLQRHMRTHTGEKPYQCDLCEKAFSRKEKMQEHRRTHTGERPLVCPFCEKTFKDSSNLSNHKKIHQSGYVPRKRKRNAVKGQSINSVIIPPGQPIVPTEITGSDLTGSITTIATEKPDQSTGKENALKDLATITTTIEDLQSASQEWLRQFVGTTIDQNDIRNLINFQAAISLQGNALNLSAEDVRSLQLIINGVQSRTTASGDGNSSEISQ